MGGYDNFSQFNAEKNCRGAHVIVCGNEKGGSGKTTTCMHIVVDLLKSGFRVATIDLDARQQSLTRYIENRKNWSLSQKLDLQIPTHHHFDLSLADSVEEARSRDFTSLERAISDIEYRHDFVVIDTPGSDNYLMRLAHSMADTLVTPMNDSFIDFDVLGRVNPETLKILDVSHYALTVREARRKRRHVDNGLMDWVVVRNRLSSANSRNNQKLMGCVKELSLQLGYRVADGIAERMIFREYFPMGLTALDNLEVRFDGSRNLPSHMAARQEIRKLINALRLPVDTRGRKRADARKVWLEKSNQPLKMPDIFAD